MFNPGKISVKESLEKDSAIVNMDLEEYDEEIPPIELERIQTQTDYNFVREDSRVFISYLSTQAGLMAVLLDSFRIRQFSKTSRLALNSKIAPIEVGIMISSRNSSDDEKVKNLGRYIELNLTNEKINVLFGDNLETFDDLGIPFVLMIDKNSLDNQGVIQIRDRETTWNEQIHLSHVVPRMVKIFQHKEIPDTLTSVRQKYKLI